MQRFWKIKKRGEEELHKLEWAPRNEKQAHWNKNRSKGKNDTFFNEIDDLEKSRQVWKVFLVFRAENVLFLCCGKARETKENVFNEVVYIFRGFSGFSKAQKKQSRGP